MFANLLKSLLAPEPAQLAPSDARLAIAALLVRVARSDNHYAESEIQRINRVLQTRYGLDAATAATLRQDGEMLEQEAPDTVRFTRAIKDAVPYDDRTAVIEALWQIALADGDRDDDED
ncbi:MAG: TerB family tellurite resistance protein, partial [Marinovum sp.]|nr:TerB family tellurite resistance protein [Marinovum sp.]